MVWVAVDKDGAECAYTCEPIRNTTFWSVSDIRYKFVPLPKGTIKEVIGKELAWEDNPVKI